MMDSIIGLIGERATLKARSRRSVTSYLDSFYDRISTQKKVNARFIEKCNDGEALPDSR